MSPQRANWIAVNTGLTNTYVRALAIDPDTPTTLYAGTGGGVFKSTNGGANWSAVNTGLTTYFPPPLFWGLDRHFLRHSSRFCLKIAGIPTCSSSCLKQNCINRLFFGLKKPFDADPLWRVAENK